MADSLYVHIPFCSHICPYCDFPKVIFNPSWASSYLEALKNETLLRTKGERFSTLFFGGGTPTCLNAENLDEMLSFFVPLCEEGAEISVEANPETLDEEKIVILARHGVNRVSLGVQSTHEKGLKLLGRHHDIETVKKVVEMLRKHGIANINLDWMYGWPTETIEDVQRDIEGFLSFDVPHISAYSLILEAGTVYAIKGIKPLQDDEQQDHFILIRDALKNAGYERYEVSNFARPGYRCHHNLCYWNDEDYIGVGLGAAGAMGKTRYTNTKSVSKYLKGEYEGEVESLDETDEKEIFFLTTLRKVEGFTKSEYKRRFGSEFLEDYGLRAEQLKQRGLLDIGQDRICCSQEGLDFLDTVLVELFL